MHIGFMNALSGMRSAITRHDVTAHNVANVNTAGFESSRVNQTDIRPQGTRVSSTQKIPNKSADLSGTDPATSSVEQINSKSTISFNARMMKVQQNMTGELLDMVG